MALDSQKMENPCKFTQGIDGTQPVAIVILNWNGRHLLEEYLPQVIEASDSAVSRIIVADNGSTDDSLQYLRDNYGTRIGIIAFDSNYGFAEGYNKALKICAAYPYTVLLNSDVAPTPGWDTTLHEFMETHPAVAGCQPKILAYKDKSRFEYAGASGGYLDRDAYPFCRGRVFGDCEIDGGQYDTVANVHWASGACLMVRTDVYLQCGGLDKDFFAHMEEIDLCWRMRLAGYKLACVPQAVVYHLGGGSLPAENPFKTYLNFRNSLLMMHKNLPNGQRGPALFRRRLLDTLAWLKFVAAFDMKNAASVLKAHRDFATMRKRYTGHPDINLLRAPGAYRKSILWQYFAKRKKKFSDLKWTCE